MIDLWLPPKPAIILPAEPARSRQAKKNMLMPFFCPGGKPPVTSISYRSASASNGANINVPAGTSKGDILVLFTLAATSGTTSGPGYVNPAGFTTVGTTPRTDGNGVWRLAINVKIATGDETTIAGMSGANANTKNMLCFTPNVPASLLNIFDVEMVSTSGNPNPQTINAAGATPPCLVICGFAGSSGTNTRSFSPAPDGTVTNSATGYNTALAYKIYNESPAGNTVVDIADQSTANSLLSFYMTVE